MSNDKNIENFDSFFNEAFNSFEPTPPKGVFEAMQSQIGSASGGTAAGTTTAAKAGAWGVGKIIVGVVATVAIATAVYVGVPSKEDKNANTTTQNIEAQADNTSEKLENKNTSNNENNSGLVASSETEITNPIENTNTSTQVTISDEGSAQAENAGLTTFQETSSVEGLNNSGDIPSTPNSSSPKNNDEKLEVENPKENKINVPIYLSDKTLCANERLTVTIADDLSKNKYKVNFGDGSYANTVIGKPTTHTYKNSGKYKITAIENRGDKVTIEQWVNVVKAKAAFSVENSNAGTFKFVNKCEGAVHYTWFFGDNSAISQEISPTHTFKNFAPKTYKVKLIAMDNYGCLDSFSTYVKQTYTYEDKKPKMYNVFSPGVDGRNDHYEIEINDEEKYHLVVLDKSGNKVFESNDKNIMWSGRNMYTGDNCPSANYIVMFSYKIKGFEEQQTKKFVTLVR